ncbi:peptidoglycan DD-metalloendopeptidase family protein [bacterium]|nr:peptidoglycan DD-metalloendopeptidase family protein [bacterium]
MKVWVSAFFFLFLPCAVSQAATMQDAQLELKTYKQNIQQERKDLNAVKKKIQQKRQVIRKQKKQERSILRDIQRIGKKMEEAEEAHQDNLDNLALVKNRVIDIRTQITQTESEIKRMQQFLAARLRMIYRERQSGIWRVLATSQTMTQALSRMKFFHVVAAQNAYVVERLNLERKMLLERTRQLIREEQKSEEMETASRRTLGKIKQHKHTREKILKGVRRERGQHEKAARELDAASKKLNRLITMLKKRASRIQKRIAQYGKLFAKRKSTLSWPTRGRVVTKFGKSRHPRFNTYIYNKGIDIKGSIGQNVISVGQGQVLFAEWFEGFGRMIILDHGGGYNTVYAHLRKILVNEGDTVKEGQAIGTLGESGTWKGPVLYFEIRKRGKALNPSSWLEK